LTEEFTERTAGIWLPLVFYAVGGVYMLAFWGVFDRTAYHLTALGILSLALAAGLYAMSRWAFWIGIISFPLYFVEFFYALFSSVNLMGWSPNIPTAAFHASMILYLVFLVFSLILLIDKRTTLKSDRILDMLRRPVQAPAESEKS
jgi:hypothetical protein